MNPNASIPLLVLLTMSAAPRLESIALPGQPGAVRMDYLGVERTAGRLWVPAGNTGNVDVVDVASGKVVAIGGFPAVEREGHVRGPSSVTFSARMAYVGNRGDGTVCAVELASLSRRGCLTLPSAPDGLAYVAPTEEVWVTTPGSRSVTVVSVREPGQPTLAKVLPLSGEPEGYAVDGERGIFFTNLEDADQTLAIDVRTRAVVQKVSPGCGQAGPRGLDFDATRRLLWVACTEHVVVLDAAHGLRTRGQVATGQGLDNIAFAPGPAVLYAAAGRSGTLTVVHWNEDGTWGPSVTLPTAPGVRAVVVAPDGTAFLADSSGGRLLVLRGRPLNP